jgi:hypothetical protein
MKKMIALLILSVSSLAFAGQLRLTNLVCEAANGVSLKTVGLSHSGTHVVEAEWGGYTKLFKAELAQVGLSQENSTVALSKDGRNQYSLSLAMDPSLRGYQMAEGALLGVSLGQVYTIAKVSCRIQLENKK